MKEEPVLNTATGHEETNGNTGFFAELSQFSDNFKALIPPLDVLVLFALCQKIMVFHIEEEPDFIDGINTVSICRILLKEELGFFKEPR